MTPTLASALAAHRFGLGDADPAAMVGADARGWLLAQIGPADAADPTLALPDTSTALQVLTEARRNPGDRAGADALRAQSQADQRARLATAVASRRPLAERLAMFWCNHFTVSLAKGSAQGLVGAFEREAIRPHIAGRFADLLAAALQHPAMLRYLDNHQSAGPQSALARRAAATGRRAPGLNENLARELLELHTLGVAGGGGVHGPWGGYHQGDVVALAGLLSGWRGPMPAAGAALAAGAIGNAAIAADGPGAAAMAFALFDPRWHQPGDKVILNRRYAEGPQALRSVLDDLARQPATARHIATKLARHLVADSPPPALVARLADVFQRSDGDLAAVYRALIDAPEAWQPQPAKLRTPEEFVIASLRLLRATDARPRLDGTVAALTALGQRPQAAPSPAGWSDRADDWLGPEAMWRRVEWAHRLAERAGRQTDARALAQASLGPLLGDDSRQQINRAADGPQALTLLLLAPEFQRR